MEPRINNRKLVRYVFGIFFLEKKGISPISKISHTHTHNSLFHRIKLHQANSLFSHADMIWENVFVVQQNARNDQNEGQRSKKKKNEARKESFNAIYCRAILEFIIMFHRGEFQKERKKKPNWFLCA